MKRCLLRPIKMRKCLNLMITENLRSSLKVRHQAHESMSSRIIPIRSCARSRASYFRQSRSYATRSPLKPRRGVLDIGLLGLTGESSTPEYLTFSTSFLTFKLLVISRNCYNGNSCILVVEEATKTFNVHGRYT